MCYIFIKLFFMYLKFWTCLEMKKEVYKLFSSSTEANGSLLSITERFCTACAWSTLINRCLLGCITPGGLRLWKLFATIDPLFPAWNSDTGEKRSALRKITHWSFGSYRKHTTKEGNPISGSFSLFIYARPALHFLKANIYFFFVNKKIHSVYHCQQTSQIIEIKFFFLFILYICICSERRKIPYLLILIFYINKNKKRITNQIW